MASFLDQSIGSIRAWFPSLKSTEHHFGAVVILFVGQVRSLRSTGTNEVYRLIGIALGSCFGKDISKPLLLLSNSQEFFVGLGGVNSSSKSGAAVMPLSRQSPRRGNRLLGPVAATKEEA